MTQRDRSRRSSIMDRLSRRTRLGELSLSLADDPANGFAAWSRTTAGVVAMLLILQAVTGLLLAFYYVPAADAAHSTVSFMEKVLPSGSWIRALHSHGSTWLALALALHLAQMYWRAAYRRRPVAWLAAVALLALIMAGGATGYSLPWDARAFYGTQVAAGIAEGFPLIGGAARRWLLGGDDLSTLTISRLYALHILVLPALIILTGCARLFIFRDLTGPSHATEEAPAKRAWAREQLARNLIVAGAVFLILSLSATRFPAPLGPPPQEAAPGYLPRPGPQFLWLFQLLKYLPDYLASPFVATLVALLFAGLAALPFLPAVLREPKLSRSHRIGAYIFAGFLAFVAVLTALAYYTDARDPRVREQLARQAAEEAAFRQHPFTPRRLTMEAAQARRAMTPPASYTAHCARCHGARGEGGVLPPPLIGVTAKPRRSVEDIIAILHNPSAYGLAANMPSFATKLTPEEKREIAEWLTTLR